MKFTEEIYSQISFMEIIVIIVKTRRVHVINIFWGYAYSKLRDYFNICRQILFQCQE